MTRLTKETTMTRFTVLFAFLVLSFGKLGTAEENEDKQAELKKTIRKADIILIGKVTQTGLGIASSFDVGVIEVSKVLHGNDKIKSVEFMFQSSGNGVVAPYGKVGVEGVWILKGKDVMGVLSFRPLAEEETVKTLIKEVKKNKEKK